ncbi:MAG TPA: glycosyltransferase family 87 protein [Candidatus Ozemobacteraceae bacterium]|nr:glycosyltransferase family 87 protein [Candidatus Ozemobacteraceae bacterium]
MWFLEDEPTTADVPIQRRILRVLGRVSLVCLVSCFVALTYFFYLYSWYALTRMNDFGNFLQTARLIRAGIHDPYAPGVHTLVSLSDIHLHLLNMNPPQFHMFLYPLLGCSNELAAGIWLLLQLLACGVGLFVIFRTLGLASLRIRTRIGLLFLLMLSAPTLAILITGQFAFILFLLVTLAWRNFLVGRWIRGATYLGLGLGVKLYFLIFVPWLLFRRKWIAATSMIGVAALLFGLSYALQGSAPMSSWFGAMNGIHWLWLPMNASLLGFLDRVFTSHPLYYAPLVDGHSFLGPLRICLVLILGIVVGMTLYFRRKDINYELALLLVSAQLLQPLGNVYYVWLIAAPIVPIVREWRTKLQMKDAPIGLKLLLGISLAGFITPLNFFNLFPIHPFFTMTTGSVYFWALLTLWLALLFYPPERLVPIQR